MNDWWHQLIASKAEIAMAGLAGGVAASVSDWRGWLVLSRMVVVGVLCAIYLSPFALPVIESSLSWLKLDDDAGPAASGFLMGAFGLIFIEFLLAAVRIRLKGDE